MMTERWSGTPRMQGLCSARQSPFFRSRAVHRGQWKHVGNSLIQNGSQRVHRPQRSAGIVRAAADTKQEQASTSSSPNDGSEEFYEVWIEKPLGIRFNRGGDGGTYVTAVEPKKGNVDDQVEVGDRVVKVSASFGEDVWDAGNYGQCMYAIKTRNGELYFKFLKRYGDLSIFEEQEMSEAEKMFKRERGGGNYGQGTKELQTMNYKNRKEREAKREQLFESGLEKFNAKEIQGALYDFEEVIAMERKQPVTTRDFNKTSSMYRVAHYNVACCYSALKQIDTGLEALDTSMKSGFDQFGKIRTDPNLENLRDSPKFKDLIEQYDEPVIDTNLFKGFGGLGGLFGGKK